MSSARVRIRVTPRSSRNEVLGYQESLLHVKVTAPPVEGAANAAIIRLLSDYFDVPKSRISLAVGAKGREKTFEVEGMTAEELAERLSKPLKR